MRTLKRRRSRMRVERLHDTLRHEDDREDERKRQQDVDDRAVQVAPEVAEADAGAATGDFVNVRTRPDINRSFSSCCRCTC